MLQFIVMSKVSALSFHSLRGNSAPSFIEDVKIRTFEAFPLPLKEISVKQMYLDTPEVQILFCANE